MLLILVGLVVVYSSHHFPAVASCHRLHRPPPPLPPRLFYPTLPVAQCRCRWQLAVHESAAVQPHAEPFSSWSSAAAAAASHFSGGAASGASFAARALPCEVFEGDSAGQNRIDCSFSAVCAKLRGCKVYSSVHRRHANSSCSLFACASGCVCPAPARAGLLSFSLSLVLSPPPLKLLLTIAQTLLSGSLCCSIVRLEESTSRCAPPHLLLIPLKPQPSNYCTCTVQY